MESRNGTTGEKQGLVGSKAAGSKKRVRRGKNEIFKFHVVNMDKLTKNFSGELVVQ